MLHFYGGSIASIIGADLVPLPPWLSGKESSANARDMGSILGSGRFPGKGSDNPLQYFFFPTPVFLPWKSHEQRSLDGYSLWHHKELDATYPTNV